jgi:predicted nucleic acid-binding protein
MRSFVDTNILVYAFSDDDPGKQTAATALMRQLIDANDVVISTQILQELFVTLIRKFAAKLRVAEAEDIVRDLANHPVIQVDVAIILAATSRVRTGSLSFWDALVVESALAAGATRLLTEDLQHGQVFDGQLRVENPFLPSESVPSAPSP